MFPGAFCRVYQPVHVLRRADRLVGHVEDEVTRVNPSTGRQPAWFDIYNHDPMLLLGSTQRAERKELQSELRRIATAGFALRGRERVRLGLRRGVADRNGNPFFSSPFADAKDDD